MKHLLAPTLDDLRAEYVLMQAWKKTANYLRQHSWYADTLEIDFQSLRIPEFIREIQRRLDSPLSWTSSPLAFVPAPKSQSWELKKEIWTPGKDIAKKIRPLAHLALQDQVVSTAFLMCLADRVEQRLGDPLLSIKSSVNRRHILAYGHRLFCDVTSGNLRHRWGSSKLYRLYFRDYQTFLRRPEVVAAELKPLSGDREIAIVQSDLSKFYDTVRPPILHGKVAQFLTATEKNEFFELFKRVFHWSWHDTERAKQYAKLHNVTDFESVALPQGLVASGFFANVVLTDFDAALRESIDQPIDDAGRLILKDVCYYVDDLRLVCLAEKSIDEKEIERLVQEWLQRTLNENAPGLIVETSKTKATVIDRQKRFLVPQSKSAQRIQNDVSGVFDMLHGTELIGAIEGFFHTQKRYSSATENDPALGPGLLIGISDMRDDTAARFAAGKFRRTFRSLRPLLASDVTPQRDAEKGDDDDEDADINLPGSLVLSREQLDERAQLFSAILIDEWVSNPGNVRLLRIGLDLYPDAGFLDRILGILSPGWNKVSGSRTSSREVQQYCLAEIFRAGATETGIVSDEDCLPSRINIDNYHQRLTREAINILEAYAVAKSCKKRFPWFLLQQVLLYLIIQDKVPKRIAGEKKTETSGSISPSEDPNNVVIVKRMGKELRRYQRFTQFMADTLKVPLAERAIYLILARSSFALDNALETISARRISPDFLRILGEISPETAAIVWEQLKGDSTEGQAQVARALGLAHGTTGGADTTLATIALREQNPFWLEENLLKLAAQLLSVPVSDWPEVLTPWQIKCDVSDAAGVAFKQLKQDSVSITSSIPRGTHLFSLPEWCTTPEEKQKFQLGMVLRFALRGKLDFYSAEWPRRPRKLPRYSVPTSHWERQRYSTFQGRAAFGPPWIPFSSWTEDFLFDLLRWPGSGLSSPPTSIFEWIGKLRRRLDVLKKSRGDATKLPFLETTASWPANPPSEWERPLRVGIVQSVTPDKKDYEDHLFDPQLLSDSAFRLRQRQHLAVVLEAVIQMLRVRETHRNQNRQDSRTVDLLIFPELAIHTLDIRPLIMPFVQTHKCIMLFGQVYHPACPNAKLPLINSCVWAIPEWRAQNGFQVRLVEQGKEHLTKEELAFSPQPLPFRPAQWLLDYHWSSDLNKRPLRMSASVCYDATDLALASDLKSRNDLYIVCALNQDVGTFDRMSEGLHYHMYQGVIVVNNGQYGGSSFFMPFKNSFQRQVFHLHGQPQASIAFTEISPEKLVNRDYVNNGNPDGEWKTPPAGWQKVILP